MLIILLLKFFQGAPGLGQEDFLQTKMRQDGAFITRFKPETRQIEFITNNAIPHSKWPFRQKAAYDAMLSLAEGIKNYQIRTNGRTPAAIRHCGAGEKSELVKDLSEVRTVYRHFLV